MNQPLWQYYKELDSMTLFDGKTHTFFRSGIRREDGFRLIKLFEEGFICKGDFGEFRFKAKRSENSTNGRYIIYPNEFDPKWPGNEKINQELIMKHLKDIESGLLHFPTVFYFDYEPENVSTTEESN